MNASHKHKVLKNYFTVFLLLSCSACSRFLEIDPPKSQVYSETVFQNEGTAIGAVLGLYHGLSIGFAGSATGSVGVYAGMSADEIVFVSRSSFPQVEREEINQNNISPSNGSVLTLWSSMYAVLYRANGILEQLRENTHLTLSTKNQLQGEAHFIRAFTLFHLVNFFGEVPLATTTDYRLNATLAPSSTDAIYAQITDDLEAASNLLSPSYSGADRLRVNKYTAVAFSARVSLYQEDWAKAEELSSQVIAQIDLYNLEEDLERVFLVGSREAIWQGASHISNSNTNEANVYITNNEHFLTQQLLASLSMEDRRRDFWVWLKTPDDDVYVPYKYKSVSPANTVEHSVRLRLVEQYFIRAEANLKIGKLSDAITDLDIVRSRAGLQPIANLKPDISQEDLADSIAVERQRELFSEWGHRWFDLKRTGKAVEVLSPIKTGFTEEDVWYPIPENERLKNPNLANNN